MFSFSNFFVVVVIRYRLLSFGIGALGWGAVYLNYVGRIDQ